MTSAEMHTELARLIQADSAERGRAISKLGYFCAPFRPASGPLTDRVVKVYRGLPDGAALERLAAMHSAYVDALTLTGIELPRTDFYLVPMARTRVPVIVQQALPDDSMMRPQMIEATRAQALQMMQAAGEVIATFWNNAHKIEARVGFHPSIRNFAYLEGRAVFFDTFPPLIGYTRDEMGDMLLTFSACGACGQCLPLASCRCGSVSRVGARVCCKRHGDLGRGSDCPDGRAAETAGLLDRVS